jgi:hypothetical protein
LLHSHPLLQRASFSDGGAANSARYLIPSEVECKPGSFQVVSFASSKWRSTTGGFIGSGWIVPQAHLFRHQSWCSALHIMCRTYALLAEADESDGAQESAG